MTYTQKNKDEKGKKSKECNKIETENNDKNNFNNDYNDSNKKGKALKVSTRKTLKNKKKILTSFLKRDCLKILAVSFSKINQVSFVAMISFSFIIIIILIITIVFLILILLICLYFQFIFYPSLLSIIRNSFWCYYFTTFIFIFFPFYYFLVYVHFCPIFPHFFPFLPFFFPFVLHLNVIIFSFIPTGLLKILREERQDHPNYRQNSSPFSLCCCIIIIGLEKDNIRLYFSVPSHTYHL